MDIEAPTPLLGGLSPQAFMRRHWQKKPLLVRQAWPYVVPPVSRGELFALAARDDVESRLVQQRGAGWVLRHGPLSRRALPPLAQRQWTLLVQGLDLHAQSAHDMLARFRFVPEARLDDLMVSYATDGGGVGPHLDAYDVFLLQVQGRRRWRIGPVRHPQWAEEVPLKLLRNFEPEQEWVLEPGDMLYLPPLWGHDGIAEGECMTCSIGFRTPARGALAHDLLQHLAEGLETDAQQALYRDPRQPATAEPGRIPEALQLFAREALQHALHDEAALARSLGEVLSEPKPVVWFDPGEAWQGGAVRLDRRSRMMYDGQHVFLNGESFRAGGRDAQLMRRLADGRELAARDMARLSEAAKALVDEWMRAGWLRPAEAEKG